MDPIDKGMLERRFHQECAGECDVCRHYICTDERDEKVSLHCALIKDAPIIFGSWRDCGKTVGGLDLLQCSRCRILQIMDDYRDFCPNCGAKMLR